MSRHWYPIIDLALCDRCGACIRKCTHGVYDRLSTVPVVVFPEGCVEGCRGCQLRCKKHAIAFAGEAADVSFGADRQHIKIEYLYLDDRVCSRCMETKEILASALAKLKTVLSEAGYAFDVETIWIDSPEKAKRHRLRSSPTIRVNGVDLSPDVVESDCPDCGTLCHTAMTCRAWTDERGVASVPTVGLLMRLILQSVFSETKQDENGPYEMPDPIRRFFAGRDV